MNEQSHVRIENDFLHHDALGSVGTLTIGVKYYVTVLGKDVGALVFLGFISDRECFRNGGCYMCLSEGSLRNATHYWSRDIQRMDLVT